MNKSTGKIQLPLQAISLTMGFTAWTAISPLMPFMTDFEITEGEKSLIIAIPVILGSILRIPFGYLTNIIGARLIFLISFIFLMFPIFYLSIANSTTDLIIAGLFLGVGGAVFSVGVTSLPKYYPKERAGYANGMYGLGNLGTALSAFLAPPIAMAIGWQSTVRLYMVALGIMILANFFLGDKFEKKVKAPLKEQIIQVSKDYKVYLLSFWYFISFGSFVAFGLFLPNYLVSTFDLTPVDAGLRTGTFIALATVCRPLGGILGDKLAPLSTTRTVFIGLIIGALLLSSNHHIFFFTVGCLLVAICAGLGNGLIFKLLPMFYTKEAGTVNGIVSMMGGLGGFFPPLIITSVVASFGTSKPAFFLLALSGIIALITMFWMGKKEESVQ